MADLPIHPDTDEPPDPAPGTGGGPRWAVIAGIAAVAVLVMVMIVLHATGVMGPGSH